MLGGMGLVLTLATGCTVGAPGQPEPTSPERTSPAPEPGRYAPDLEGYCDLLRIPEIFTGLGLSLDPEQSSAHYDEEGPPGADGRRSPFRGKATCFFGTPETDVAVSLSGAVIADVHASADHARRTYTIDSRHPVEDAAGELGPGWWTEARFYELEQRRFFVSYAAHRDNLASQVWVYWHGFDEIEDLDQVRTTYHDLLAVLLERSIEGVPLAEDAPAGD